MSEPIPESVPTSQDPRSRRPVKKRALTPVSEQAGKVEALFSKPDREIHIPIAATKDGAPKAQALPPEIVANVQGSSAGAGSGEFHVYKASRRREYERIRHMEEELKKEKDQEEFEKKQEELRRKDEAKTNKNKAKREKMKARKLKAKTGGKSETSTSDGGKNGIEDQGQVGAVNEQVMAAPPASNSVVASTENTGLVIHDDS